MWRATCRADGNIGAVVGFGILPRPLPLPTASAHPTAARGHVTFRRSALVGAEEPLSLSWTRRAAHGGPARGRRRPPTARSEELILAALAQPASEKPRAKPWVAPRGPGRGRACRACSSAGSPAAR